MITERKVMQGYGLMLICVHCGYACRVHQDLFAHGVGLRGAGVHRLLREAHLHPYVSPPKNKPPRNIIICFGKGNNILYFGSNRDLRAGGPKRSDSVCPECAYTALRDFCFLSEV